MIFVNYNPSFNPTDSFNHTSTLLTICHFDADSRFVQGVITWFIVLLIFIPFFVLIFIYTRIIWELARHRAVRMMTVNKTQQQQFEDEIYSVNGGGLPVNADHQRSNSFLSYKRFEQKRLNTVIICVITVAFFACQFPVRIIQLTNMYFPMRKDEIMGQLTWIWLWKLSKLLFFLNFTANPVRKKRKLCLLIECFSPVDYL